MKLIYLAIAVLFTVVESGEERLPFRTVLELIDNFHFFRLVNLLILLIDDLRPL